MLGVWPGKSYTPSLHAPMNPKMLYEAIGSAKSVKLGLASNPESSSAWVKTLIDPAHAREYGCRGIPDENQQPSLVLCGRDTTTYTPYTLPGNGNSFYYLNDSNVWTQGTAGDISFIYVSDVYMFQLGIRNPLMFLYIGWGTYRESSCWVLQLVFSNTLVNTDNSLARLVAQSSTVSWVGKEIDRAGYFEAGYYLPRAFVGSDAQLTVNIDDFSNLVSFTSDASEGVYAISTFNDYDIYRYWKGTTNYKAIINVLGSQIVLPQRVEYCAPQGFGGMRPYFVHFSVYSSGRDSETNNSWAFRVTTNQVVERLCPYSSGGSDAAIYDRMSVEDMIALYDSFDLLFPASYNDFKKVWNYIKRNGPKALSFVVSVMRHFPNDTVKTVGDAIDMLVNQTKAENFRRATVWEKAAQGALNTRVRNQKRKKLVAKKA